MKVGSAKTKETLKRLPGCVGRAAADLALRLVVRSSDHLIGRALSNSAHVMLDQGRAIGALVNAVAAVRCDGGAHSTTQTALYGAGVACAVLSQPQAALYFLDQVRSL